MNPHSVDSGAPRVEAAVAENFPPTLRSAELYAKRGAALLDNAQQGLHALQLAEELAL
ncbi:MAG: hypothetical protein OXN44_03720 [Acidimicrobiaceae bacterium]|nr:hypothetical protein [Acidimicrobiaceae bacterium]MDE0606600.1 hypothetical protein [Acidimicrobiaceae bacterium]